MKNSHRSLPFPECSGGQFLLWTGENKVVFVHFSSFNLFMSPALHPKPPWHVQFCWQLSLSHRFSGCVGFLGDFLAASAKDWLFHSIQSCSNSPVCSVQNEEGWAGDTSQLSWHTLGTVAALLAGSERTPSSSVCTPHSPGLIWVGFFGCS